MFKTVCLQVVILLGFVGCGGEKKGEGEMSDQSSSDPQTAAANPVTAIKINKGQAQKIYSDYSARVGKDLPVSPCSTITHKLKYLRIKKGDVYEHLRIAKDSHLPEKDTEYASVRLYPCPLSVGENRFILAYTSAETERKHNDKPDSYYLILISGTIKWCKVYENHFKGDWQTKSNHKLCDPDCPDVPSLTF